MAKKEIVIKGNFLVASGKPLKYAAYEQPVRKGDTMLEALKNKGYLPATYLHPDDNNRSTSLGEIEDMYLVDADPTASKNSHSAYKCLRTKTIKADPRILDKMDNGVFGLSIEYNIDSKNLEYDDEGNIVIEDHNAVYRNVALVPNPRHSVADIDLKTGRLIQGSMYDSEDVSEDDVFFVVTDENVYLHDAENSAIIYTKNNITSSVDQVLDLIKDGVGNLFSKFNEKQEDIPVNKEEFQEVLNSVLDKKFEEKFASQTQALKDSMDSLAKTEEESKALKEKFEILEKENKELKDSNEEMQKNITEKEAVIQTMSQELEDKSDEDSENKEEDDKKDKNKRKDSKNMKDSKDVDLSILDNI